MRQILVRVCHYFFFSYGPFGFSSFSSLAYLAIRLIQVSTRELASFRPPQMKPLRIFILLGVPFLFFILSGWFILKSMIPTPPFSFLSPAGYDAVITRRFDGRALPFLASRFFPRFPCPSTPGPLEPPFYRVGFDSAVCTPGRAGTNRSRLSVRSALTSFNCLLVPLGLQLRFSHRGRERDPVYHLFPTPVCGLPLISPLEV